MGIIGAKNPAKVPARDFGEEETGANGVGSGLRQPKKLPSGVRLVSSEQKNSPDVIGVIFREKKIGRENV
jgi:hypothetical protein